MIKENKGITKLEPHSQGTTRNKFKTIARAQNMSHGDLMDKVQDHMMNCTDPDCDICDKGESGSSLDQDEEGEEKASNSHNRGTRSSTYRTGSGRRIDEEGKSAVKESKSDKHNLMKHGQEVKHTSKHPGFQAVKEKIAGKQHISEKAAARILAFRSRNASAAAKHANPRLKRVAG